MKIEDIKHLVLDREKINEHIVIDEFIKKAESAKSNAEIVSRALSELKNSGISYVLWTDLHSKTIKLPAHDAIKLAKEKKLPVKREDNEIIANFMGCTISSSGDSEHLLSIIKEVNSINIVGQKIRDVNDLASVLSKVDMSEINKDEIVNWMNSIHKYELAEKFDKIMSARGQEEKLRKQLLILTLKDIKRELENELSKPNRI